MDNEKLKNITVDISKEALDIKNVMLMIKEYEIASQFIRSASSIGANYSEAQFAESHRDYIHKLSIAMKECKETLYWLDLISHMDVVEEKKMASIIAKCREVDISFKFIIGRMRRKYL